MAAKSEALTLPAVQQLLTSATPLTGEHQHTLFSTKTGSLQIRLESEINSMQSDVGAKFGDAAAPDTTEFQPDLQEALEVQTSRTWKQAAKLKESASKNTRVPRLKKISKNHLPNKRVLISSTEAEAPWSTITEPVKSLEGVEIKPDDPPHSESRNSKILCRRCLKAAKGKGMQVVIELDDEPVLKESAEQMCFKPHRTCWSTDNNHCDTPNSSICLLECAGTFAQCR